MGLAAAPTGDEQPLGFARGHSIGSRLDDPPLEKQHVLSEEFFLDPLVATSIEDCWDKHLQTIGTT